MTMTSEDIEKGFQEVWKLIAETGKQIKDTNQQLKETDKKIEKLIGRWSLFVEGLVLPAAKKLFHERGIEIEHISQHAEVTRNGQEGIEIDILGVNGEYAVLIEAKSTLDVQAIDEHLERLSKFKTFFPEYRDKKPLVRLREL